MRGKVVDDHGEALPGATVLVSGGGLSRPVVAVTRPDGTFLVSDLPPGRYTVLVQLEGFSSREQFAQIPAGKFADLALTLSNAITETITVVSESPLLDERQARSDEKKRKKDEADTYDFDAFEEMAVQLKNGLVGGVRPLPVTIPETGKLLLLSGALPPARVGVELEIKGKE
jgi:hypothetical protein